MNIVYSNFLYLFFTQQIDIVNEDFKVVLLRTSYEPDHAHITYSDIEAYEVSASGYLQGGADLTNIAINHDAALGVAYATADPVSWEESSITAQYAVIYKDDPLCGNPLVACFDFGVAKQSLNGTLTLTWDEKGFLQLGQAASIQSFME